MKKILFISHSLDDSGAQAMLKNIVVALNKNEFDIKVYSPVDGALRGSYLDNNIPVFINDFYIDRINREQEIYFNEKKIKKFIHNAEKNKDAIAIRCAGSITQRLLSDFDFSKTWLVGIFDNNPALIGTELCGYPVYSADEMADFNISKSIIAHHQPKFLIKEIHKCKIKVLDKILNKNPFKKYHKRLGYLKEFFIAAKYFQNIDHNILFVNNARNFWAVLIGKMLHKKVIWAIHEAFEPKTFRVFPQPFYFFSFKCADKFIFPSYSTYKYYQDFVPKNKVSIVYDGVDSAAISNDENNHEKIKNEFGISSSNKVIYAESISEDALIHFTNAAVNLLKASKHNENKEKADFIFVIAGIQEKELSSVIEKTNLEQGYKENFKFLPLSDESSRYFSIADIYVNTSMSAAFLSSDFKAMALKKPIIAVDIPEKSEIITNNETGILVSAENIELDLVKSVQYLVKNPNFMSKLSENAYKNYLEKFAFDNTLREYYNVIKSIKSGVKNE